MEAFEGKKGLVITIDGPAASGKTSVSRELAHRLGWSWVSTGAFYRGLGFVAMSLRYSLDNEEELSKLARDERWFVEMAPHNTLVFFDNRDVTGEISQERVGDIASQISHLPKVREALLGAQRKCALKANGLVAEGRDCGTVVFPEADLKFYLTARQEDRAERRARDLGLQVEAVVRTQVQRDQQDSSRKTAPMRIPTDAMEIDTTNLDLCQVVELIESSVRRFGEAK